MRNVQRNFSCGRRQHESSNLGERQIPLYLTHPPPFTPSTFPLLAPLPKEKRKRERERSSTLSNKSSPNVIHISKNQLLPRLFIHVRAGIQ